MDFVANIMLMGLTWLLLKWWFWVGYALLLTIAAIAKSRRS